MRMRRKPWARPELEECEFFIDNPCENIGKWHGCFKKKQPIHMELGCGKGSFAAKIACKNPNINYMVIDIKSEMLALAKRNIEKEYTGKDMQIDNVLLMSQEIELIQNMMNKEDVVDRIYINFCNPWPKRTHNRRRLTHTKQLEKYKIFLKKDGEIYFKTDDDELFESSLKYLEEAGFDIVKTSYDLHSTGDKFLDNEKNFFGEDFRKDCFVTVDKDMEPFIIRTEHEEMFSEKGIKIKALVSKLNV